MDGAAGEWTRAGQSRRGDEGDRGDARKGRGIIGMKLVGNGDFTNADDRERALKFALTCGCVDAVVMGFESVARAGRSDRSDESPPRRGGVNADAARAARAARRGGVWRLSGAGRRAIRRGSQRQLHGAQTRRRHLHGTRRHDRLADHARRGRRGRQPVPRHGETVPRRRASRERRAPIDLLINTHHHPRSHVRQHRLQAGGQHIVAHQNVPALQKRSAEQQNALADRPMPTRLRQRMVAGPRPRNLEAAVLRSGPHQRRHRRDVRQRQRRARRRPGVSPAPSRRRSRPAGGTIEHWISRAREIERAHDNDTIYMFGHAREGAGTSGTVADLRWRCATI